MCRAAANEFLCGFGRKKICGSAVRKHEPSSGRKVSRVSVTEGARGTEKRQKTEGFRRLNSNPSVAYGAAPAPFAQGSHGLMQILALCRREKQGKISRFQNRKQRKAESCALSFSRLRRQLPLGGSHCLCGFSLCAAEKTGTKIKASKSKVCVFAFCGKAAALP